MQRIAAAPAQIAVALFYQRMAARGKRHVVRAGAAIQILGAASAGHSVVVAAISRQLEQSGHQRLPFAAMRANAVAVQLMGNQMRHLVGNGLLQKVRAVLPVHLTIKAQQVAIKVGNAGALAAQLAPLTGDMLTMADIAAAETRLLALSDAIGQRYFLQLRKTQSADILA